MRPNATQIHRKALRESHESAYKTMCPFCGEGWFPMIRDWKGTIQSIDMCTHCNTVVEYMDLHDFNLV